MALFSLLLVVLLAIAAFLLSLLDWSRLNKDFFLLALEFIKVLAWPGIVLVGILVFSGEVKRVIGRINSVEWKGATAQLGPNSSSQSPPADDTERLNDEVNEDAAGQRPGETNEEFEDRIYRKPEIQLAFERTYRFIFGTQIALLYKIAGTPGQTLSTGKIRPYYEQHLQLLSSENSFQNYIGFLTTQGLLSYDSATDSYQLLPAGQLFLRYLIEQGINDPTHKTL